MKDLYDSPVFTQWRDRAKAGTLTKFWLVEEGLPEAAKLVSAGQLHLEITDEGIVFRPLVDGRVYYPVPETMPGPQEICTHIIGSGALSCSWWEVKPDGWINFDDGYGIIDPAWEIRVTFGADDFEEGQPGVLNPTNLAQGIMRVRSGATSAPPDLVHQCAMFAAGNLDDVDFDAGDADYIMQVAITGDDAVYG